MTKDQTYVWNEANWRTCHRSTEGAHKMSQEDNMVLNKKRYRARNHERLMKYQAEWRAKNSLKMSVHRKVGKAIKSGKIIKPSTCSVCSGLGPIDAHHNDYSKPLDVVWLCRRCHYKLHGGFPKHTKVSKRGSENYHAKLSEGDVKIIRRRLLTNTEEQVAELFGVSRGTINSIRRRKTWKHVT